MAIVTRPDRGSRATTITALQGTGLGRVACRLFRLRFFGSALLRISVIPAEGPARSFTDSFFTGRAYAMDPPRRMRDLKANFPAGVYQVEVDTSVTSINPRNWHFVVADHQCNTTI